MLTGCRVLGDTQPGCQCNNGADLSTVAGRVDVELGAWKPKMSELRRTQPALFGERICGYSQTRFEPSSAVTGWGASGLCSVLCLMGSS